jgi:TonB family protein
MQDPVAEVLEQRAALGRGLGGAVALSLVAHAIATAAAVYAAMHQEPPKTASILNIKLAPIAQPARPAAPSAKPAEPAKPLLHEPHPVVQQPKPKPATKPEPKTVPFSPFGKSTRKGSDAAPPPPTAPAAQPSAGVLAADVPVGSAGVTGLEGGDFPYTIYIERMKTLIGTHWFRPQVVAGISTTVRFTIDRDGTIREVKTETTSGNGTFDRAALRAVMEASPLPPLPFAYSGTFLGVHLTFK